MREARFLAFIAVGEHVRRENPPEPAFFESGSWTAVSSEAGDVCFRTGDEISLRLGRRDIETDARAVALRPSGAFLVADGSYLLVDGREVFRAESPVKQHIGRL
jgi:hypothetical protein